MNITKFDLLTVLVYHIGIGNGITVAALAQQLHATPRHVRELVTELRLDGIALCGTPRDGYYIAATAEELRASVDFLVHRARHSLMLASRMSKIALPDLLGQMHLPT